MKLTYKIISKLKDERGVSAIVVAVVLAMLIGFLALAIDIGYLYSTKNELQNTADAAALAGAGYLGQIYKPMSSTETAAYIMDDGDSSAIKEAARSVVGNASRNLVAGKTNMEITDGDITIFNMNSVPGTWEDKIHYGDDPNQPDITSQPDAVRVIVRRESGTNGPITTFFARIFGIDTAEVFADATAALTGPAIADEGEMNLPIGISKWQFYNDCIESPETKRELTEEFCSQLIQFSPTTSSCAGWHNFFDPVNANALAEKLLGFIQANVCEEGDVCAGIPEGDPLNGDAWLDQKFDIADNKTPEGETTPPTNVGEPYFFQGGTISSLFNGGWLLWDDDPSPPLGDDGIRTIPRPQDPNLPYHPINNPQAIDGQAKTPAPFPALFDYFRFRDGDGNNAVWTAAAPVYDDPECCSNPNTELPILGFVKVVVSMPNPPPDSTVTAKVSCKWDTIDARGGGITYGNLKGTIPNLVE